MMMKTLKQIIHNKNIKELLTIEPNRPVVDALIIMAEYKIGALIVMEKDKLIGIISERDYAREIVLEGQSSKSTLVKDIMTEKVLTLNQTDTFEKGLQIMTEKRIRHLPVLQNKKVIGIVSQGDLVKEMIEHQKWLIQQLETFIQA